MNYEEAIKVLKAIHSSESSTSLKEALHVAITAMEKQIPKSPIKKEWDPSECPSCGAALSEFLGDGYYKDYITLKFCDCGQRLKWK